MALLFKILVTAIVVGASTYLNGQLKDHWLVEWSVIPSTVGTSVIAAIAIVIVDFVSDSIGRALLRPTVAISTSRQENEIDLRLDIKGSVDRISLNYPLLGTITNFQDLNSLTGARTIAAKVVGGTASSSVQNNLQISTTDIKKNATLQYKIFFEPSQQAVQIVAGTDRYELVYTWEYSGEKIQGAKWYKTADDHVATEPSIQVIDAQVFNRPLAPEEIKKLYEAGPHQRSVR